MKPSIRQKVLHHDIAIFHLADLVAVTFEMQKKDKKIDTVHHKATKDANMCPVRAAAAIMRRIHNYKDSNDDTPISTVDLRGRRSNVMSKQMTSALQDTISVIGEDALNIKTSEVGNTLTLSDRVVPWQCLLEVALSL